MKLGRTVIQLGNWSAPPPGLAFLLSHAFLLWGLASISNAQVGASNPGDSPKRPSAELSPWRVFQRRADNRADIPISDNLIGEGADSVSIQVPNRRDFESWKVRDGKIIDLPTGGPYYITGGHFGPIFVGDLWVLAGQSNMEGVGDLVDVTPPSDRVAALGMDGKWVKAEEPLHWLVDSPDPVHSGNPADREKRSADQHRTRTKGAGLGLPFGVLMESATKVPVGLVICAHGGTSMAQWDPAKKGEGGNSLYGSMIRQINLAGGKVRGVLWYQGESDAMGGAAQAYPKVFTDFIGVVRRDLGQPELPFYFVQIGRFIHAGETKGWNAVQDAQRRIPDQVANTAVVAAIDLELDDLIHVGTYGLKRLGTRLARIALREQFGQAGATTPTFDHIYKQGDNVFVVKFKGVNRASSRSSGGRSVNLSGLNISATLFSPSIVPTSAQPLDRLQPSRHIGGFSIRKDDGTEIPLIFEAAVGPSRDTVILKLIGKVPDGAKLWYGYGLDPYCNLTAALDMAVPVFGPIALDDVK